MSKLSEMQNQPKSLKFFTIFLHLLLLQAPTHSLTADGLLLLSFKHSILSDPLSVLQSWNSTDETPCSWIGVTCSDLGITASDDQFRVTGLVLPSRMLLGSVLDNLFHIEHLRHLDLSDNLFNGTLPSSDFNSSELQVLSLSKNAISGELPESVTGMRGLKLLNLSDNALKGTLPRDFSGLKNLTVLSLRGNNFSGDVPIGFLSVEVLDLSSNLFNGSLPADFGGQNLRYLNLSGNKISGPISVEFARKFMRNSTIDLSFNDLTGAIPGSPVLVNQKAESFSGNVDLCGKPLKNLCSIPSTLSTPPNISVAISPAVAVIPKTIGMDPKIAGNRSDGGGLKPGFVAVIAVTNLTGVAVLAMLMLYVYQQKQRNRDATTKTEQKTEVSVLENQTEKIPRSAQPWSVSCSCLNMKAGEESSETTTTSSDSEEKETNGTSLSHTESEKKGGELVTVDGETKLELETLLKAAAYVVGTSEGSIVYKAVVADGTAFAVRRVDGERCCIERKMDFERHVREISKLKHRNLVRVRGFYWGYEEKLLICDYISNGSLACSTHRSRPSPSPCHFPLEVRLKIARGVARGVAFIHEKKHVHGNIKPSNILLDSQMEPIISDLGLDRLIVSNANHKPRPSSASARFLSSQLSQDLAQPSCTSIASSTPALSPYQAPESWKNLKLDPKWDVYSFGIILLELLCGKLTSHRELGQCVSIGSNHSVQEEKDWVLMMADSAIRSDVVGKEDALLEWFRLGFSCASIAPQKRPVMKEALKVLENSFA